MLKHTIWVWVKTFVFIYTVNEVTDKKAVGLDFGEVYVDELEDVLNFLLGLKVRKATLTRRP